MRVIHAIFYFFDKMEDHIRGHLKNHPFIYTIVGGVGVVLFWRGVWHVADGLESAGGWSSVIFSSWGSIVTGMVILLATGLFVSMLIGDSFIMSGVKKEEKDIAKTEGQIGEEKTDIEKVLEMTQEMKKEIEILEEKVDQKNGVN